MDTKQSKKIVHKVTPDMNRDDLLCTTYQMRNFYRQLGDGFFSTLDTMNYIQHHQIVRWCKKGMKILDIACGRGLMLPLLRYGAKNIYSYTGVDIEPKNAIFNQKRVTDNKPIPDDYYPFRVDFIENNVATMHETLPSNYFDVLIYTSAIEHMHKDMGQASLHAAYKVAKKDAMLILTCPNTPENQDGFDTQYAAHIYEWKRSELITGLTAAGWTIITEYGLHIDYATLSEQMERLGLLPFLERIEKFVPREWLIPVFAPMFPKHAKEIAFVCQKAS